MKKLLGFFAVAALFFSLKCSVPRLAVVFIIDQFASFHLKRQLPFMTGGIKFLCDNGVYYKTAFMPHGLPSTATGHTMISTGCFANEHGIIGNSWVDEFGNKIVLSSELVKCKKIIFFFFHKKYTKYYYILTT